MPQLMPTRQQSEKAIDAASNADAVNQAVADGTTKIQNDYKPGQSLDDQKAAAKANLDKVAEDTKAKINGDATLTSAEKAAQSAAVDADKAAGEKAIDAASNADAVKPSSS
ncbi:hypothetical protein AKUH4B406M_14440 [Apilactobacillus kunkeei]|nr:hypothetical protein AKUH4B406M_14440 [Apilactobacillus kunkeei]